MLTQSSLSEIASTVGKASIATEQIAQASVQQAEGIRQILAGTDQMNMVTKRAAANAEESAAAAQELTSQAESLNGMVGRFSLSETSHNTRVAETPRPLAARGSTPSREGRELAVW